MPEINSNVYLNMLENCGGFYSCPKDKNGKRLGPLVGYAATYEGPEGKKLQLVGDIYANFAKAETHSKILRLMAQSLIVELEGRKLGSLQRGCKAIFCGAPIGGYSLSDALGLLTGFSVIKAEKKIIALATETSREKSKLVFARHDIQPGCCYIIVEDVTNNFTTTEELIALIHSAGGKVLAIACFLNRSLTVEDTYYSTTLAGNVPASCLNVESCKIPVISLVRLPIDEWGQDHPAVAEDIVSGNVVWKPKNEWGRLMTAMHARVGAA